MPGDYPFWGLCPKYVVWAQLAPGRELIVESTDRMTGVSSHFDTRTFGLSTYAAK
jgi:hypothetical protein